MRVLIPVDQVDRWQTISTIVTADAFAGRAAPGGSGEPVWWLMPDDRPADIDAGETATHLVHDDPAFAVRHAAWPAALAAAPRTSVDGLDLAQLEDAFASELAAAGAALTEEVVDGP